MSNEKNHSEKLTHLTPEMMKRYKQGELTPMEQHAVEKHLLDNPFEAEAMEGVMGNEFMNDVNALQTKIADRTSKEETKVIPIWRRYYGIAAAITIIAVSLFLIFNLFKPEKASDQLAMEEKLEETTPLIIEDTLEITEPEISLADETENFEKDKSPVETSNRTKSTPEEPEFIDKKPTVKETDVEETGAEDLQIDFDETIAIIEIADEESTEIAEEETLTVVQDDAKIESLALFSEEKEALPRMVENAKTSKKSKFSRAAAQQEITLSANERIVRGQITSIEDGMPIPGVNVVIKGTTTGTITDIDGFYEIAMSEDEVLVYSFIGYTSEEIESGDKTEIDISMYADVAQLSEVVVTGYGSERPTPPPKSARPSIGYYTYRKYLKDNLIYPQQALDSAIEGKVVIEFDVVASGALQNFDIRKSLGFGCDEEAIRLIKEGATWTPGEENGSPITKTVRIKVKFEIE